MDLDRPARHHLAQLNVARLREPLDSALLVGFVALLGPVNALADRSPGFVWRLQTDDGDATSIRPFDDEHMIVNLSVWSSRESLWDFVYRSGHLEVMQRRREWFHRLAEPWTVLWWVAAGGVPSLDEARQRLALLRRLGPTPAAFTFRQPFPAPDGEGALRDRPLRARARS